MTTREAVQDLLRAGWIPSDIAKVLELSLVIVYRYQAEMEPRDDAADRVKRSYVEIHSLLAR
jgi:DNA invertase Pin-like site-specific DNA recombinase